MGMITGKQLQKRLGTFAMFFLFCLLTANYAAFPGHAASQEAKDPFNLVLAYTDVTVGAGQDFEMDAEIVNGRKTLVQVKVSTQSVPEGWTVGFHSRYPSYPVRGIMVKGEDSKTLELKAKIPENIEPGTYKITVVAKDKNGTRTQSEKVTIRVSSKKVETGGLKITSQYPDLSGPSTRPFKFTIDLKNETDTPLTTSLAALAPPDWRVRIKPQFEETQISSIALKKDASETLSVEIDAPVLTKPGDYPVTLKARSGPYDAQIELKVKLTVTYDLRMGRQSGILNAAATAGEKTQIDFVVVNAGTAPINKLSFLSEKPEKWTVDFKPDKIDVLNPGEAKQIDMGVLAPKRAIVGDYILKITSNNPETSKSVDFRVTVSTPTIWGWIGLLIVAAVILGLAMVFVRLGRR